MFLNSNPYNEGSLEKLPVEKVNVKKAGGEEYQTLMMKIKKSRWELKKDLPKPNVNWEKLRR